MEDQKEAVESKTQVIEDPAETMDLETAKKVLGLSKEFSGERILQFFEVSHWVAKENEDLDEIPKLILAKNVLIRSIICEQMKARRYFRIISPFDHSCKSCHGTGELYKFKDKIVEVTCHLCGGTGERWVKCPTCKGTGRYNVRWKEGGGIDVECRHCLPQKGTEKAGKVPIRCIQCNRELPDGEENPNPGKMKKIVKSHIMESTTPCKHCHELGFTTNLPYKQTRAYKERQRMKKQIKPKQSVKTHHSNCMGEPVLSADLACKIKESIENQSDA